MESDSLLNFFLFPKTTREVVPSHTSKLVKEGKGGG
jgi:hypothetical protein